MYYNRYHTILIAVSNFRPHIRPITRGKAKTKMEFGTNVLMSIEKRFFPTLVEFGI